MSEISSACSLDTCEDEPKIRIWIQMIKIRFVPVKFNAIHRIIAIHNLRASVNFSWQVPTLIGNFIVDSI